MHRLLRHLTLLFAATSGPAFADMTANYAGPNNFMTMKIEIASNGDVRGTTSSPNSYFITRAGHGYLVQASFDGPVVMRIEDVATVMAEQMKRLMPNMPTDVEKNAPAFDLEKGGSVMVRGRQGTAYYMGKPGGPAEKPMLVISADPTLAPLAAAMAGQFEMSIAMMGRVMGRTNPFSGMQRILKTGAPLVFTGMELDSVNNDTIPASHFVLPAEPATLDVVRKNMGAPTQ